MRQNWRKTRPLSMARDRDERVAGNIVALVHGEASPALAGCDGRRTVLESIREFEHARGEETDIRAVLRELRELERQGRAEVSYRSVATAGSLAEDLRALGVREGDTLLVHSALSALGPLCEGVETLFSAFETVLGARGTLAMPAFAYNTVKDYPDAPFDAQTTPSRVGELTNIFRQRAGVVRSLHPSHGLAAQGANAAYLVRDNRRFSPYDRRGAFGKLYRLDAKILMIGCGLASNSTLHALEDWAGLPSMLPDTYHYRDAAGRRRVITYAKEPFFHRDFYTHAVSAYETLCRDAAIITEGQFGIARAFIMPTRELMDFALARIAKGNLDILYCPNEKCETCQKMQANSGVRRSPCVSAQVERRFPFTPAHEHKLT